MTIAKLFTRIGVKADQGVVNRFDKSVKGLKIGLIAAIGVATTFSLAIKKITQEAFDAAAAFKQFEAETGSSAQELQKWQAVANQTNNSAEAVTSSIKALVSNQEKIKLGQGNISGFQLLGIDPRQDPFKILEQLKEKTAGLSQGMKKNTLAQMGISSDLIQVLELTNKEFDSMASKAFIIPQSAINALDKARASGQLLGNAVNYLKTMIAARLSPVIAKINKQIARWIKQNQEGIIKTIQTIFRWIHKFLTAVGRAASMINEVISGTIGWANAMKILIAVFAVLNAQLLFSPIGLIIAGIILLVAVLDDLYVYSKGGGQSLFGNLMEKFPELEDKLKNIWQVVKDLASVWKAIFSGDTSGIHDLMKDWGVFGKIIESITTYFINLNQALSDLISGKGFKKLGEFMLPKILASAQGVLSGNPLNGVSAILGLDKIGPAGSLKGLFGGGNSDSTTNNNDSTVINVNTTADAGGTAAEIERQQQMRRNQASSSRGAQE